MTTTKTSVSLTPEAVAAAQAAARRSGVSVSAWLSQAAIEQAWREQAIAAADELYQEAVTVHGEPTAADQQWIADVLARTVGDGIAAAQPAAEAHRTAA